MEEGKTGTNWVLPALLGSLVAGSGFGWYLSSTTQAPVNQAALVQGTGAVGSAAPASQPATLVAPAQASVTAPAAALTEGQQVIATLQSLPKTTTTSEVTRSTSVDLLGTTQAPAALVAPQPVAQPAPTPTPEQIAASASFFANAQANLAAQNVCGDDLKALAAGARVYFPTGGLSPGDPGLVKARLIGKVALECPGYTVQVEGHSDRSGNPRANQILSQQRADVVISRLAAGGIDTSRFVAVGFGDKRPSGTVGPLDSAYYDRRVEFSIVKNTQQASLNTSSTTWQPAGAGDCVSRLQAKAAQTRIFFAPRSVTVSPDELNAVRTLASEVESCPGTRLRLVGHHADDPTNRETLATGRFRVLAMRSTLESAGFDARKILIGAPSASQNVAGQPGLPNSRVDFQIIQD